MEVSQESIDLARSEARKGCVISTLAIVLFIPWTLLVIGYALGSSFTFDGCVLKVVAGFMWLASLYMTISAVESYDEDKVRLRHLTARQSRPTVKQREIYRQMDDDWLSRPLERE